MERTRAVGWGYRLSSVLSGPPPCCGDMEVGCWWSKRKLDLRDWAGSRASSPLRPYISRSDRGGVGAALPLVSPEMIACPWARREEAALLQTLRSSWKESFLLYFSKPIFLSSVVAFIGPRLRRFSTSVEKRSVSCFAWNWIAYHIILCSAAGDPLDHCMISLLLSCIRQSFFKWTVPRLMKNTTRTLFNFWCGFYSTPLEVHKRVNVIPVLLPTDFLPLPLLCPKKV